MSLVLIVENCPAMALESARLLKARGHECLTTQSLPESVSMFQERRPALVLTESYLAEGEGLELARQLLDLSPQTPVIMATALGNEETASEFLSLGGFEYIVKTAGYLDNLPQMVERTLARRKTLNELKEKETQTRRLEAQNELSSWLAHNFKNIIAAAMGYLHLTDLKNPDQPKEKQLEYLGDCKDSLGRALKLLEQLEEMTQGGAGEAEKLIVAEEVDLAWERVRHKMIAQAREKNIDDGQKMKDFLDRVAFLNATRSLSPQFLVRRDLASIMEALLQNALEALTQTDPARILVRGEIKNNCLELTTKDNGRGMNEKVLQHALEPLFSTKGEVGVGLSLSLVQSLVARHGGTFELASAPNLGATATIIWPV